MAPGLEANELESLSRESGTPSSGVTDSGGVLDIDVIGVVRDSTGGIIVAIVGTCVDRVPWVITQAKIKK